MFRRFFQDLIFKLTYPVVHGAVETLFESEEPEKVASDEERRETDDNDMFERQVLVRDEDGSLREVD